MKNLFIGLTLLASMSSFANEIAPVGASKFTGSIDQAFFDQCLNNLEDNESHTKKCRVFESPEGSVILSDAGYIGSLRYITSWSESHCSLQKGVTGRLYLQTTDTSIELIMEDTKCLKAMNEAVKKQGFPLKDKSLFLLNLK
ncbi:MAG: hypothetical protein ACXVLQ_09010 [Bacteriovorax sp.]